MTQQFTALILRYSANVPAMVAFLEELGLRRRISSEGFAELAAGAGRVMVHGASTEYPAGETYLSLFTPSLETAAPAGVEITIWDESYGRHGLLTGPFGEQIWINEDMADTYGYEVGTDEVPAPELVASAIRETPDFAGDREFFSRLGFVPAPGGNEWFEALQGPGTAGVIGLHAPSERSRLVREDSSDPRGRMPYARLGFQTAEELEALSSRLTAVGYPARVVEADGLRKVHVVDPDGIEIEIHPR